MDVSNNTTIVILGETGSGKSSLANTIFGKNVFEVGHSFNSQTRECKAETKSVHNRSITLIDTPGFFYADRPEEELKAEIVRCITECASGTHAFIIVLKVEKFTEQEQAVIRKILTYYSEEALKYATVVFTHGDQLNKGQTIMDFVSQNQLLSDLVKKCGGRCHVVDNKYWKNNQQDKNRSNKFQVKELLNSIDKIEAKRGGCYTNEMLQTVQKAIQAERRSIGQTSGKMSEEQIRKQAKVSTSKALLAKLTGIAAGALLAALFGVGAMAGLMSKSVHSGQVIPKTAKAAGAEAFGVKGKTASVVTAGAAIGKEKRSLTGYDDAAVVSKPKKSRFS